jgi:regulatory protein
MKKNQKITDIQVKKNNINRRKLYIDNMLFIEIDDVIISELDLYIGKEVTNELIDKIQKKETFTKAKNDAIRFLSYRPRSEWEISNKLKNKKYPIFIIEETIYWLKEKNLINDRQFSLMWIRDRLTNKPLGKLRIRKELYNKGIDSEIIESTVNSFIKTDEDELELAYQLIERRRNSLRLKNVQLEPQKIINLLKNRGFSNYVIKHIYDGLLD